MRKHFRDQTFDRPPHADKNAQGPGIYLSADRAEAQGYMGPGGKLHVITLKPGARIKDHRTKPPRAFLSKLIKFAPKDRREIGLSNWDENPKAALDRALRMYGSEDEWLQGTLGIYHDFYGSHHHRDFAAANVRAGVDAIRVGQHLVVYNPEILLIQKHEALDADEQRIRAAPIDELVSEHYGEPISVGALTERQEAVIRRILLESQLVKHYFDFKKMPGGYSKSQDKHVDDARKVSNHPVIMQAFQVIRKIWGKLERTTSRKERFAMVRAAAGPKLSRYMKSVPESVDEAIPLDHTNSRADFLKQDYVVGDSWDSPEGKRTITRIGGGQASIKTDGVTFEMRIPAKEIGYEVFRDVKNVVSRAATQKSLAAKAQAEKDEISLWGYETTVSPMQRGKAVAALNRRAKHGGGFMKIKDIVRKMVDAGHRVKGDRLINDQGVFVDKKQIGAHGLALATYLTTKKESVDEAAKPSIRQIAKIITGMAGKEARYYVGYEDGSVKAVDRLPPASPKVVFAITATGEARSQYGAPGAGPDGKKEYAWDTMSNDTYAAVRAWIKRHAPKGVGEGSYAYGKRDSGSTTDDERHWDASVRQKAHKKRKTFRQPGTKAYGYTGVFPAGVAPGQTAYEEIEPSEQDESDLKKLAGMMAQRGRHASSRTKGKKITTGSRD